jgi:hypothetical protein
MPRPLRGFLAEVPEFRPWSLGSTVGSPLSYLPVLTEADIRESLTGVLPTDVVEMASYHVDWGSRYWWRIVRDGRVVAALIVGEQGGGVINGWTCPSSGIGGDPPST